MVDESGAEQTINQELEEAPPSIPENINRDWVEKALAVGQVENVGKTYFFREYSRETKMWLIDHYGLPTSGQDGDGYIYHGTNVEKLPGIARLGIFGIPNHPTLSAFETEEVKNAAKYRNSRSGIGLIAVWKTKWNDVEIPEDSWPEPMGWPNKKYEDRRDDLPLGNHLKNSPDLRQLPPDNIIGYFIIKQHK